MNVQLPLISNETHELLFSTDPSCSVEPRRRRSRREGKVSGLVRVSINRNLVAQRIAQIHCAQIKKKCLHQFSHLKNKRRSQQLLSEREKLLSEEGRKEREREMVRKGGVVFDEGPPDDFDPANPYKDPVAMLEMREHLVREKWIDIETAKIIRERLKWCYRVEGVNHLQNCKHLVEQYLESTRGIGWGKSARPPEFHAPKKQPISDD